LCAFARLCLITFFGVDMNKDDIIRMAREAGFTLTHQSNMGLELYLCSPKDIEMFAQVVEAAEREACAKVCEGFVMGSPFATAIRARGQQ
jgi:hypothetical protein